MPKLKTKSSVKKRFGKTGSGKVKRTYAHKRHCLSSKSKKMKRNARGTVILDVTNFDTVIRFMPYA